MEQQMNLFEEGGMKDDGLDRDPVSGNEIPPGSLAKEVRDDIPAQLSDGEYVVPADVVQYFGVKFFEDLRAEAKRGLAEMEATGRIGGEPVEVDMTMIAFGKADDKKKKKKAEGGMIGYSNGGVADDVAEIEKARTFNPVDFATLGFTPVSPVAQTGQLQQNNITKTVTYYDGDTGESRVVTFVNGIVTPPEDVKYTQPPWSTIKPSPTKVTEKEDRSDRQELSAKRVQEDIEFALSQSAKRLGIPLDEYKTYSTGKRIAFGMEELKDITGRDMDQENIDKIRKTPDNEIGGVGGIVNNIISSFEKSPIGKLLGLSVGGEKVIDILETNSNNQNNNTNLNNEGNDLPSFTTDAYGTSMEELAAARRKKIIENPDYIPRSVDADLIKEADAVPAQRFKKEEDKFDRDTPFAGTVKEGINKGGLLQKPKRRNKK